MKKATICADTNTDEGDIVEQWLAKWHSTLAYCSENEGCGCCVDIYNVEAPEEALAELPNSVLSASDWAGNG